MKKAVTSSQSNPFTSPKSTRKRIEEGLARTDVKRSMLLKERMKLSTGKMRVEKDRASGGKLFLNHNHNHHKRITKRVSLSVDRSWNAP
jgi:hypothetical protein